jgi:hypothetical protein
MMGMRVPETCWAVFKRQVINLRICCIWLVDSVESIYQDLFGKVEERDDLEILGVDGKILLKWIVRE